MVCDGTKMRRLGVEVIDLCGIYVSNQTSPHRRAGTDIIITNSDRAGVVAWGELGRRYSRVRGRQNGRRSKRQDVVEPESIGTQVSI